MATGDTVASIPAPQSGLSPILDFSKWIAGQQQAGSGSSTSATAGQTLPLEQLIAQMSDPNNLANLVANLFNQGAAQVPALTSQFANATGTRVSNNSMLAQSLAQLNTNIAQQLAQAVVQQQGQAATAAGKLAETNKTATTQQSKTEVTKPASVAKGIGTTALGIGAGSLLNKFGDKLLQKTGLGGADSTPNTGPVTINAPSPDVAGVEYGITPPLPMANAGSDVTDASMIGDASFPGAAATTDVTDASMIGDGSFPAADSTSAMLPTDGGDQVANMDFSDFNFGDFGDFGFANGGQIPHFIIIHGGAPMPQQRTIDNSNAAARGMANGGSVQRGSGRMMKPANGYADGGTIDPTTMKRRNVANMGTAGNSAGGTPAVNMQMQSMPLTALDGLAPDLSNNINPISTSVKRPTPTGAQNVDTGGSDAPGGPGNVAASPNSIAPSIGPAAVAAALSSFNPVAVAMNLFMQTILNNANNDPVDTSLGVTVANDADAGVANGPDDPGTPGVDASTGANSGESPDSGPAGGTDSSGVGDAGSAGDGGPGGGDGGGSGAGDLADGGTVKARSKRAMSGVDQQPIMATPGEYMLPIDVVNYIGKDTLDDLVSLVHMPVLRGN